MPKLRSLSSLSLTQMFSLGLGLLIALMVAMIVGSFVVIDHVSSIFLEYRKNSSMTLSVNDDLEDILEARTAALKYRDRPSESWAQEVRQNLQEFMDGAAYLDRIPNEISNKAILSGLAAQARAYLDAFEETSRSQANLRKRVQRLSALGPSAREDLSVALSMSTGDNDSKTTQSVALAIQTLMLGRFYTERFLVRKESADLHRALLELQTSARLTEDLSAAQTQDEFQSRIGSANAKILEYSELAREIHAIALDQILLQRETLDTVGPEISSQLDLALDELTARQNALGINGETTTTEARRFVVFAVVVLLAVSLVASAGFVRWLSSIVNNLTTVMERLAQGGGVDIPESYLQRSDALGKMARALRVFKRNTEELREQQKLLSEYSETLERERARAERLSLVDGLTQLENRRSFDERLEAILEDETDKREVTLLHVDLDEFKGINDTLGHAAGDQVLVRAAEVLRSVTEGDAFAARVGGDEFVVILRGSEEDLNLPGICQRLLLTLSQPLAVEGRQITCSASIGLATTGREDVMDLSARADFALYRAKENGRGRFELFTGAMKTGMDLARELADDLQRAVHTGEIIPYFQPQIDVETGEIHGVEALARWNHPTKGLLDPPKFLKIAEQFGLIAEIDARIFRASVEAMRMLEASGRGVPKLSINCDERRLSSPKFEADLGLADTIEARLCIELLETVLLDIDRDEAVWQLDAWRERGVDIEIDDFGTSHASIVGLQKIRPDRIKIDRQLVQAGCATPEGQIVLRSMIDMARSLSVGIIAEGVEDDAQSELVARLGCSLQQGYAFGRPMCLTDLEMFLDKYRSRDVKSA